MPATSSKSPRRPPRPSTAATRGPAASNAATDGRLWLVCFQSDEPSLPGAPGQSQSFQLVVRGKTPRAAIDACRRRLRELRTTSGLFDTPCSIYLDHLIAIDGVGSTPALVNYVSKVSNERGEILCAVPEQTDAQVEGFGWNGDDGPFLDFGGQHVNKLVRQALQADHPSPPSAPAPRRRRGPR